MKRISLLYSFCFFILNSLANPISDIPKQEPYPNAQLGQFGEHLSKFDYYLFRSIDSAGFYLNSAYSCMNKSSELEQMIYYLYKSSLGFYTGDDNMFEYAQKGIEIASQHQLTYYEFKFHQLLGIKIQYEESEEALKHCLKALELSKFLKNDADIVATLINLANYEVKHERKENALSYLADIRPKLSSKDVPVIESIRYYTIMSRLSDDKTMALNYLDTAQQVASFEHMHNIVVGLLAYKGRINLEYGEYKASINYFIEAENLAKKLDTPELIEQSYVFISSAYLGCENCEMAIRYFEMFMNSDYKTSSLADGINEKGYTLYKTCKQYEKAIQFSNQHIQALERRVERKYDSLKVEYDNKYNLDKIKHDNILKTETIKHESFKNKMITLVSLGLIFFIVVFSYVRLKAQQQKTRLSRALLQKERENNIFRIKFIEHITHEIKTPLTMISGVFDFLQSRTLDQDIDEFVQIGEKNTTQLKDEVNHILTSVRTENYLYSSTKEEVNLNSFFNELIEDLSVKIFSKGLSVKLEHNLLPESKGFLELEKVKTIFLNFLNNAIKHSTDKNCVYIRIYAQTSTLKFYIENTGSYLTEKEQIHIFDRYYQAKDANNQEFSHGIGLHLAKELADSMEAKIGVTSVKKELKTSFFLELNTSITTYNTSSVIHTIETPHAHTPNTFTNKQEAKPHLLIIDDNELMIRFYLKILNKHFICDYTLDGQEAINKIEHQQYDCILADVIMPGMDGFEFVKQAKHILHQPVPILFVTGNNHNSVLTDALNIGVQDVILKPFVIKELIHRIKNIIANSVNRKENHTQKPTEFDDKILKNIIKHIDNNIQNVDFNITELATAVFYSKRQLNRKVVELTGLTPGKLILERRLIKAYNLLNNSNSVRISEVQQAVGIKSSSYFFKKFKERFGVTPSNVRSTLSSEIT